MLLCNQVLVAGGDALAVVAAIGAEPQAEETYSVEVALVTKYYEAAVGLLVDSGEFRAWCDELVGTEAADLRGIVRGIVYVATGDAEEDVQRLRKVVDLLELEECDRDPESYTGVWSGFVVVYGPENEDLEEACADEGFEYVWDQKRLREVVECAEWQETAEAVAAATATATASSTPPSDDIFDVSSLVASLVDARAAARSMDPADREAYAHSVTAELLDKHAFPT